MKIGILGGTFDPVHKAHIEIAKVAGCKLGLDKVLFIPNGTPPHKDKTSISGEHKINMLSLAIKDYKNFEIDRFEVDNKGPSYLYLTLEYLNKKYKDDELYFLAGADNIKTISNWKNPHLIFKYANIVFITRPGYVFDLNTINKLTEKFGGKISFIEFEGIDVSSTKIREEFENFKEVKHFLCDDVYSYIAEKSLYPSNALNKLSSMLNEKRMIHVKNVAKEAYYLALRYNENPEKAYYAGLLHDCSKYLDYDYQLELINKYSEYELMENELSYPKVIHALSGTIVAKREFGINDKDILDAIRYHTLGSVNMTLLDKIIYIADLISEDRNYKGVEILRKIAYNNIDKAILMSIDNTVEYLKDKRIQPDVLRLREFIKEKLNGCID